MTDDFHPALPHGDLQPLLPDVWWLQGRTRMAPGMHIPRNMVVLRHEGSLTLLHSVRLDDAGLAALDALGSVDHVVKIGGHGMDDRFYVDRYGAATWALPGAKWSVPQVDHVLALDAPLPVPWLQLFVFQDTVAPEAALVADRDGGLLITCDSIQAWPDLKGCSLLGKLACIAVGFARHPAVIGPPWAKGMTPPGGSLEADFLRLAALEFQHVVGGHGRPLVGVGGTEVAAAVTRTFA